MAKKRFNLTIPVEPIGRVTAGVGKPYEFEFEVPCPVGQYWARKSVEVIASLENLRTVQLSGNGQDNLIMLTAINEMIGNDRFYDDLFPAVLGIGDDPDGIAYLKTYFTPMEAFMAFSQAAGLIAERAFGGEDTQAALGKSTADEFEVIDPE